MKTIKAFTLLEMVIVLVITSFIFIAGYMAYISSVRRLSFFERNSSKSVDISELSMLLKKDIEEGTSISLSDEERLSIANSEGSEIIYFFTKENVIRQLESQTDTFNVNINSITSNPLLFDSKYLNRLSILAATNADTVRLDYEKTYDPFFMLNHDNP